MAIPTPTRLAELLVRELGYAKWDRLGMLGAIVSVALRRLGIPVKVNADSGGKPNGIPE